VGLPDLHRVWLLPDFELSWPAIWTRRPTLLLHSFLRGSLWKTVIFYCENLHPIKFINRRFNEDIAQAGVSRTNLEYGGLNPDVTRVVYTQGSLDPWHALGRDTDLSANSPVIMIDGWKSYIIWFLLFFLHMYNLHFSGHSHCRDIGGVSLNDASVLSSARAQVETILSGWLQDAKK
jgi:hypothetical protein